MLRCLGAVYSITTFIRAITSLLQIRQVAHLRSTTCNLQGLSPTQRSTQTTPSRDLTLGVMQLVTLRSPGPAGRLHARPKMTPGSHWTMHVTPHRRGEPRGQHPPDKGKLRAPEGPLRRAPARLAPCCLVASSCTGTSTHAAQTQAGMTQAGTQRHVGLAARACIDTSMHAAETQARTQHKPPC